MTNPNTPILVGCGQVLQREADPETAEGPIDLMREAALLAAEDCGITKDRLSDIDSLTVVRFITGVYEDPANLLASRLDSKPAEVIHAPTGGNTPQYIVNSTAEKIAHGETRLALVCGAEALNSMNGALTGGVQAQWAERDGAKLGPAPQTFDGTAPYEMPYGLLLPVTAYPLFENAIRANRGRSVAEHQRYLGQLMSRFTEVAATNPYSWFPQERTPEEIATATPSNRYVGFPYTKYMNAIIRVDQGAAVLLTSTAEAKRLGIPEDRWVYLHGCGDATDHWFVSERENFYRSPAIAEMGKSAFEMARWSIGDVDHIDLYSCFPSAVQYGRDALGIAEDDPRPLTVTGGLPYHGGAGNNYVTHSIATMMNRLRERPGTKGLCTALGWYATKHSIGLYSTDPIEKDWARTPPESIQAVVDARPKTKVETQPTGAAEIETYTVMHGRDGPERAIIMGRLEDQRRFVAETPKDPAIFEALMTEEAIGKKGNVRKGEKTNEFSFAD